MEWRGWGRRVEQAFGTCGEDGCCWRRSHESARGSREGQKRERGTVETAEKKKD